MLPTDSRTLAYGRTTAELLRNPEVGEKIPALFGADWMPAEPGRGLLVAGAAAYFDQGGPVRMLRVGGTDYIAVTGCVPVACDFRRVLLLIENGGSRLLARFDEGGFVHYSPPSGVAGLPLTWWRPRRSFLPVSRHALPET